MNSSTSLHHLPPASSPAMLTCSSSPCNHAFLPTAFPSSPYFSDRFLFIIKNHFPMGRLPCFSISTASTVWIFPTIQNNDVTECFTIVLQILPSSDLIRPFIHPSTHQLPPHIRCCDCSPAFSSRSWGSQWVLGNSLLLARSAGSSWSSGCLAIFNCLI